MLGYVWSLKRFSILGLWEEYVFAFNLLDYRNPIVKGKQFLLWSLLQPLSPKRTVFMYQLASPIEDTVEIQFTNLILPPLRSPSSAILCSYSYSLASHPYENVQGGALVPFNILSYFLVDPLSAFFIILVEFISIV